MRRILFAWELGGNFGHLARLVSIALKLRERGDQVLFVIRDLRHARQFLIKHGLSFISAPAPISGIRSGLKFLPTSYADILALQGMNSLAAIQPQVSAWHTIFDLFKPDAVVLDHAPVGMFAAQLADVPRIAVGTGFELPPLLQYFPLFRDASFERRQALLELEKTLLETLNQLAASNGQSSLEKSSDIFKGTRRCFVTLPELDHYGKRLDVTYLGMLQPWRDTSLAKPLSWPNGRKRILAYLQPSYPLTDQVLQLLAKGDSAVIACVPDLKHGINDALRIKVSNRFINISPLLRDADLLICHGGHGMSGEALLAAKPILILPQYLEQKMLGESIETLGAAKLLKPQRVVDELNTAVNILLDETSYRDAAIKFKCRYSEIDSDETLNRIRTEIDAQTRH